MDTPPWFVEPTYGQRLLARLLDGLVLLPVLLVSLVLPALAGVLVVALITAVYEITFIARDGQTLGKGWMRIRVVRLVDGAVPTFDDAVRRWAVPEVATLSGFLIGNASVIFALVIFGPILGRPLHRGLHDHVAGTVVTASRR